MATEPESSKPVVAESPLLTAERVLAWRRSSGQAVATGLTGSVILTNQRSLLPRRRLQFLRRTRSVASFEISRVRSQRSTVSLVTCPGVGGPGTAVVIEELAALGVRRLVAVNLAGGIDSSIQSGSVVLVDGALCGDGTSPHYCSESIARPGQGLTNVVDQALHHRGVDFSRAIAWSTDAIYRETSSLLSGARDRGAVVVDMETASVLAVSASLGIEAAAILVAADVTTDDWRPPSDMPAILAMLRSLVPIAVSCLAR